MIEINPNQFLTKPYPYQLDGIKHILKNKYAAVFDEMGVGKSKQVIDAASILFENGEIQRVIIVAPASVRGVWDNSETGEVVKHCKSNFGIIRYDNKFKETTLPDSNNHLLWITISYSFLRARLQQFITLLRKNPKSTLVVFDESSCIKSNKAQQTKACKELRKYATRAIILNGTPIANNIIDLWSQFDILDPNAIGSISYFHFRARYCLMGGFEGKEILNIVKEKDETLKRLSKPKNEQDRLWAEDKLRRIQQVEESVERLKNQLKPWVIRREKKDVLSHLPPKLPPVFLEAEMSKEGYRVYEEMRNEMVAWAQENDYSQAVNGAVKVGRLSQITSGFLGGIKRIEETEDGEELIETFSEPVEVDDSKLKVFLEWMEENNDKQVIVWCRFRAEMFRLQKKLEEKGYTTGLLIGGQKDTIRQETIHDFQQNKIQILIANAASGGFGLNLTNCHTVVYMSLSHSLIHYQQSSDRVHRNGQNMPVSYTFIVCVSPTGKPTVDKLVIDAVLNKEDLSKWTMDKWQQAVKKM